MILSCPACSAEVQFKSRSSVFGVCSFCSSTLVRHDMKLESIGKMAQLPPDLSPIQIGSAGRFNGSHFEIIGRKKMAWESGLWTEWYVMFDKGQDGWLAEAQGTWALTQVKEGATIPDKNSLVIGNTYNLGGKVFELDDIKECNCSGSSGELPMQANKGQKSVSADFTGQDGTMASIDYSEATPVLYLGKYLEFEDFKFTNLREVDGW